MLTASYSTPASDWTRAIDAALADWSKYIVGHKNLRINLHFDPSIPELATTTGMPAHVGNSNGQDIYNLQAQATLQGFSGQYEDAFLTINPSWDWSFSGEPNKYDAQSVMTHELGHALFMLPTNGGATPFELWSAANPSKVDRTGIHTPELGLMNQYGFKGDVQRVTPDTAKIAGASGTPTIFDDRIFLHAGGNIDAGAGVDTGVWLQSASTFNATLANFEYVEFPSADQFTDRQLSIWGLYQGLLDRSPDIGGFQWWDQSGLPLDGITSGIRHSAEFQALHHDPLTLIV